jgi:hypothetical protein
MMKENRDAWLSERNVLDSTKLKTNSQRLARIWARQGELDAIKLSALPCIRKVPKI